MRRDGPVVRDGVRRRATRLDGWFRRRPPRCRGADRHHVRPQHRIARRLRASARYIPELLNDVLEGRIHPGRVFDFETNLDGIAEAYAAMDERRAIKSLVTVGAKGHADD